MAKRIRAASGVSTGKADPVRKAIRLSLVTAVERCMSSHIGRPRANSGYSEQKMLTRLSDFIVRMTFRACDAPLLARYGVVHLSDPMAAGHSSRWRRDPAVRKIRVESAPDRAQYACRPPGPEWRSGRLG